MTLFDKWRAYTDWITSPDCYVDFGYYSMVASALQRRVWSGPKHSPLYPNIYTILVGEPGIGKGLVIKEISKLLKHHKLKDPREKKRNSNLTDEAAKRAAELLEKEELKEAQSKEEEFGKKHNQFEQPLLIPVAADATTYEALVLEMARSKRLINYPDVNPDGTPKLGVYTHSSLTFCLEEMSSLFRKRMEDLVHFLIQAYDCGDYNYETIKRGKDRVRCCCLNILAGTTPGFMQSMFTDSLLTEGFSSRTFFIFGAANRKTSIRFPELTNEQLQYKQEIIDHIEKLSQLYGPIHYTDDAWTFLEDWWSKAQHERPNLSQRLNYYYSRKNIHVQKIAMLLWFGEYADLSTPIGIPYFKKALEILAREEKKMHLCLGFETGNPLANVTRKVEAFICRNGSSFTFKELTAEFWQALPSNDPKEALSTVLEFLLFTGAINAELRNHPITKQETMYYFGRKESRL